MLHHLVYWCEDRECYEKQTPGACVVNYF